MLMLGDTRSQRPRGERVTIGPAQRDLMRDLPELLNVCRAILDFAADHGAQPLVVGHLRQRFDRLREEAEAAADWMQECVADAWLKERADHPKRSPARKQHATQRAEEPLRTTWARPVVGASVPAADLGDTVLATRRDEWQAWSTRREAQRGA